MHLVQFPPKMLHKVFFLVGGGGGEGVGGQIRGIMGDVQVT